jgi:hypothetical protein
MAIIFCLSFCALCIDRRRKYGSSGKYLHYSMGKTGDPTYEPNIPEWNAPMGIYSGAGSGLGYSGDRGIILCDSVCAGGQNRYGVFGKKWGRSIKGAV